jgi:hypothetical protein
MNTSPLNLPRRLRSFACALALGLPSLLSPAAGIPEPSLVLHGVLTDALGRRATNGTIQLTLTPPGGGSPIRATVPASDLASGFSFAHLIKTESVVPTRPRSANTLPLSTTPGNWRVSATRGQILRTDLSLGVDTDNNGLIDAWELLYFGKLGNSPTASAAGDGISNLAKMYAGIDPRGTATSFPNFTLAQAREDGSFLIEWSSQSGRTYTVLRGQTLDGPFDPIQSGIAATPPANRLIDTTAASIPNAFYKVQANP